VDLGRELTTQLGQAAVGLDAAVGERDRERDDVRARSVRRADDLLQRRLGTQDARAHAVQGAHERRHLESEAVLLLRKRGQKHQPSLLVHLEAHPERAEQILDDLGDEVLAANVHPAIPPLLPDRLEHRCHDLFQEEERLESPPAIPEGVDERREAVCADHLDQLAHDPALGRSATSADERFELLFAGEDGVGGAMTAGERLRHAP
jgi:hypothetical protein